MSIDKILDYYKNRHLSRVEKGLQFNKNASEEVREALTNLVKNISVRDVDLITRWEGLYRGVYSEHSPKKWQSKGNRRPGKDGWYRFYVNGRHVGQATIGYGHVLKSHLAGGKMGEWWAPYWKDGGQKITKEEAIELKMYDAMAVIYGLVRKFTVAPTKGQFMAIVSRMFNAGPGSVTANRLVRLINKGKISQANKVMMNAGNWAFTKKYEDPNWCENNIDKYRNHKKYRKIKTDAEKIKKCKSSVAYSKRYRTGWRNRICDEYGTFSGKVPNAPWCPKYVQNRYRGKAVGDDYAETEIEKQQKSWPRIYIAGDSNTYGHWKRHGASLLKKYGEDNRIINVSKIGYTLGRIRNSLKKADGAKVVFIGSAGGNNVQATNTEEQWIYPTGSKIKEVKKLMKRLKELQDGGTEIIFYGIPFGGKCTKYSKNRGYADVALQAGAKEYGIPYTSVFERTRKFRGCKSGVHYASKARKKAYREMFNELTGPDGKVTKEDLQRFIKSKRGITGAKRKFLANVFGIKQFDIVPLDKKYEPGKELTKATKGIKGSDLSDEDFTKSFSGAVDELSDENLEAYAKAMFDKGEEEIEVAQNEGIEKNNNLNCLFENWRGFLKED
tara:strand:+ start:2601 stop:4436 length:1836 start_codon:yes stop_codon:yes gene_type:complete